MQDFTPDEMAGFEREAIRPFLELSTFFQKENWSSARTNLYVRKQSNTKGDMTHGLMVLEFRSGVIGVKAELWESEAYNGEIDLDSMWDIGVAVFPNGVNETILGDILSYWGHAGTAIANATSFTQALHDLEGLFKQHVKKHETAFPEPQEEAAKWAVRQMIGS